MNKHASNTRQLWLHPSRQDGKTSRTCARKEVITGMRNVLPDSERPAHKSPLCSKAAGLRAKLSARRCLLCSKATDRTNSAQRSFDYDMLQRLRDQTDSYDIIHTLPDKTDASNTVLWIQAESYSEETASDRRQLRFNRPCSWAACLQIQLCN